MGKRRPLRAEFAVGGARADITPDFPLPTYAGGKPRRRARSDRDLHCNVLVFSHGGERGAIVCLDTTAVDRAVVLRIRDEAEHRANIPRDHIMVAATHSHSTPALAPTYLNGALPSPLYVDLVVDRTVHALQQAASAMEPAALAQGSTHAPWFAINRRFLRSNGRVCLSTANHRKPSDKPEGPVYPDMPFLAFENAAGKPIAAILSIPCHNNAVRGIRTWHRDFFGRARDVLRERLPSLRAVLTLKGPSGNIQSAVTGGDSVGRRLGRECAESVLDALAAADRGPVRRVAQGSALLTVDDRAFEESDFCTDNCRGTRPETRKAVRERYAPEKIAVRKRGRTSCLVQLQCIAFDRAAILSHPCELFSELGLGIVRKSAFGTTLISGLTNGFCGYVPTRKAFEHGGYETHRSVYVGRLAKTAGDVIVRRSAQLLRQCDAKRGGERP